MLWHTLTRKLAGMLSKALAFTYRFNGLLQAKDLLLQQMQCSRFAAMTRKCSGTGAVYAIYPILELHLHRKHKERGRERNMHIV